MAARLHERPRIGRPGRLVSEAAQPGGLPAASAPTDETVRGLCEQVRDAAGRGTRLRPRGGGSRGFLLADDDIPLLDISACQGIVDYAPSELVMTVRAGTPVAQVVAAAAEAGQLLPFEPALLDGRATIGGTVAAGLAGPRAAFAGSIRDAVLGVACINGLGEYLRFGGRVMKNVAGFDLSRLLVGSMGTLAVITEVSLKLIPRPEQEITLQLPRAGSEAIAAMRALARLPRPVTASAWYEGQWYLRLGGVGPAVDAARAAIDDGDCIDNEAFWPALREYRLPLFDAGEPVWRCLCPPAAPMPAAGLPCLLDAAGAVRWLRGAAAEAEIAGQVQQGRMQAQGFRGAPGRWFIDPSTRALRERIKAAFDPGGVFARLSAEMAC